MIENVNILNFLKIVLNIRDQYVISVIKNIVIDIYVFILNINYYYFERNPQMMPHKPFSSQMMTHKLFTSQMMTHKLFAC